jgi:hypothetical protein
MTLTLLDWDVIAGYLLLMLLLGFHFRRRALGFLASLECFLTFSMDSRAR